jgi:hypothetical protein
VDSAKEVLDILQVPAFLCQQTSLLLKVGEAGKVVNIKKGQFIAPDSMAGAVKKVRSTGNRQVLLTERGTCFGYNKLISDFCSIPVLQERGVWAIEPWANDPQKHILIHTLLYKGNIINTNLVKPQDEPKTLKELARPSGKGEW